MENERIIEQFEIVQGELKPLNRRSIVSFQRSMGIVLPSACDVVVSLLASCDAVAPGLSAPARHSIHRVGCCSGSVLLLLVIFSSSVCSRISYERALPTSRLHSLVIANTRSLQTQPSCHFHVVGRRLSIVLLLTQYNVGVYSVGAGTYSGRYFRILNFFCEPQECLVESRKLVFWNCIGFSFVCCTGRWNLRFSWIKRREAESFFKVFFQIIYRQFFYLIISGLCNISK